MQKEKVRVLGIAPYEGMKNLMQSLAEKLPSLELTVFVGDLQKGVEIAQGKFHGNYDVIISRGGTAKLLEKQVALPVVEIEITAYDILRALKLAENSAGRYAIVGFPNITGNAHLICDLLGYEADIFTIHDHTEVETTLRSIKEQGYNAILCDMLSNTTAKQLGLNAFLITSGAESIQEAFHRAMVLQTTFRTIKEENAFLRGIIQGQINQTVVFDDAGMLYFSSLSPDDSDQILEMLQAELPSVPPEGIRRFVRNIEGNVYTVFSQRIIGSRKSLSAFYFSCTKTPLTSNRCGVRYVSRQEAEQVYQNSFYSVTGPIGDLENVLRELNRNLYPIMISGEDGTGKEMVVGVLYARSRLANNPLITIDCALLSDKTWDFLMNHHASPLSDIGSTIYVQNIDVLTEERRRELRVAIINMDLCSHNKLIFSCVCKTGEQMTAAAAELVESLGCLTLNLPPLREMTSEIPALVNLYLSSLNVELAKQILGIEPEGIHLLQHYSWPHNFTQFKRIVSELAVLTTTPLIHTAQVKELLAKERVSAAVRSFAEDRSMPLDLNRTLSEIDSDIIHLVLEECGGNQTTAAKRLGISRTTLWRLLKG